MHIDPAAFTLPAPRILIGAGERAFVYDALNWGMVERRGDRDYDPVQRMWGRKGESPVDTETFGFSLEMLEQTHDALEAIVEDPDFTERPTTECQDALEIVTFAMGLLGQKILDSSE